METIFGNKVLFAFMLTFLAGLSTGIGSGIALVARKTNTKFLCISLGFSAGVMLYVSFMEILPQAIITLESIWSKKEATLYMILSLFGGMGLIAFIDMIIPHASNPHEIHGVEDMRQKNKILHRVGVMVAISIAVHNFPEGIATFTTALGELEIAIPIAVAIAIHNVPEGIAVAVPIYHATGSRRKAFWFSFLSGLAEPVGALIAYLFLMPYWSPALHGITLSAVAGIMIFISLDELLPTAEKYGEHHLAVFGIVSGMAVMAFSLFLFL